MLLVHYRYIPPESEHFVPLVMEYEELGAVYYDRIRMLRQIALPKLNGYEPRAVALAEYEDYSLLLTDLLEGKIEGICVNAEIFVE